MEQSFSSLWGAFVNLAIKFYAICIKRPQLPSAWLTSERLTSERLTRAQLTSPAYAIRAFLFVSLFSALALLISCADSQSKISLGNQLASPEDQLLVEAVITPEGGVLEVSDPTSKHFGLRLLIPPYALSSSQKISIYYQASDSPEAILTYRVEPQSLTLFSPARMQIPFSLRAVLEWENIGHPSLWQVYSQEANSVNSQNWPVVAMKTIDNREIVLEEQLCRFETDQFNTFRVLPVPIYRALYQPFEILDPLDSNELSQIAQEHLDSEDRLVLDFGKGSLESFWGATSSENLLILHGFSEHPIDLLTSHGITPGFGEGGLLGDFQNIVFLQYPSGRSISSNANLLYDQISENAGDQFSTNIVGFSMGGMLSRYLLERSHNDRDRTFYSIHDKPIGSKVVNCIHIASPHGGFGTSSIASQNSNISTGPLLDLLISQLSQHDQQFYAGVLDLYINQSDWISGLNESIDQGTSRYFHLISEASMRGTDGLVPLDEIISLLNTKPQLSEAWLLLTGDLYSHQNILSLAAQSAALPQIKHWLNKSPSENFQSAAIRAMGDPIVGPSLELSHWSFSLRLASPINSNVKIEIQYRLSSEPNSWKSVDLMPFAALSGAETDMVNGEAKVGGGSREESNWIEDTARVLVATEAPGAEYHFAWDISSFLFDQKDFVQVRVNLSQQIPGQATQFGFGGHTPWLKP